MTTTTPPAALKRLTFDEAAAALNRGEIVIAPAEPSFALCARIDQPAAVQRIARLKGRESGKPFPVAVHDIAHAHAVAAIDGKYDAALARLWPGGLTAVFPALTDLVPPLIDAQRRVAVRVPGNALLRDLVLATHALTATSCNLGGMPAARDITRVAPEIARVAAGWLPADTNMDAAVSTIADLTARPVVVFRPGAVTAGALEAALRAAGL